MNKKLSVIILDYDYTIADSSYGIFECSKYAFEKLGFADVKYEDIKKTIGHSLESMFTIITKDQSDKKRSLFKKFFLEESTKENSVLTQKTYLLPGVEKFFDILKKTDIRLAIVSTKTQKEIKEGLIKLNLDSIFDLLCGVNNVKQPKPCPEGLNYVVNTFNIKKENAVYIGIVQ